MLKKTKKTPPTLLFNPNFESSPAAWWGSRNFFVFNRKGVRRCRRGGFQWFSKSGCNDRKRGGEAHKLRTIIHIFKSRCCEKARRLFQANIIASVFISRPTKLSFIKYSPPIQKLLLPLSLSPVIYSSALTSLLRLWCLLSNSREDTLIHLRMMIERKCLLNVHRSAGSFWSSSLIVGVTVRVDLEPKQNRFKGLFVWKEKINSDSFCFKLKRDILGHILYGGIKNQCQRRGGGWFLKMYCRASWGDICSASGY